MTTATRPGPLERLQDALVRAAFFGAQVVADIRSGREMCFSSVRLAHEAATEAQRCLDEAIVRGMVSRPDLLVEFKESPGSGDAEAGACIVKGARIMETFTCEACGKALEVAAGALPPAWVIVEDQATGTRVVFCSRETAATVDRVLESRGQALAAVRRGRVQESWRPPAPPCDANPGAAVKGS